MERARERERERERERLLQQEKVLLLSRVVALTASVDRQDGLPEPIREKML